MGHTSENWRIYKSDVSFEVIHHYPILVQRIIIITPIKKVNSLYMN